MHAAAATLLDRSIDLPAAERRELIETISEETVRMEHLVTNVLELTGGNHAQFGNYGTQQGDGVATISREEQQSQAASAMLAFLLPAK